MLSLLQAADPTVLATFALAGGLALSYAVIELKRWLRRMREPE